MDDELFEMVTKRIAKAELSPREIENMLIGVLTGLEVTRPGITKRAIRALKGAKRERLEASDLRMPLFRMRRRKR